MMEKAADQIEITYYTDPLCCWSWAMEPQWRRLRFEYRGHINWRYCMGGLLPGWKNFNDPAHSVTRPVQMGPLWMEAAHLSGMPIDNRLWVTNPPASSYPACIAFACVAEQSFVMAENYLRLLREAVMIHGKNISEQNVLTELAEQLSRQHPGILDMEKFRMNLQSDAGIEKFRAHLNEVRAKGIKRFPSLLFRRPGYEPLLLQGYRTYDVWLHLMNKIAPDIKRKEVFSLEDYRCYWGHLLEREEKEARLEA